MIHQKRSLLALSLAFALNFLPGASLLQSACARPEASNATVLDEQIGDRPYQVIKVLVKARPEQVWQVITDYSGAPHIFANLKKCQVLLDKGATKIVHYSLRPSGLIATFEYDLEVKELPNRFIEWHRVGGDFKAVDGYWKLEPADCGRSTMVTYANHVNGGLFMPQALIRRQSHIDLPGVMTALKSQSERTMNLASHARATSNQ
ncbi:MAG TPA: SRPBCC family protein [Candidatus Obscuribacterales bacterium]